MIVSNKKRTDFMLYSDSVLFIFMVWFGAWVAIVQLLNKNNLVIQHATLKANGYLKDKVDLINEVKYMYVGLSCRYLQEVVWI